MSKYIVECERVSHDEILVSVYADGLKSETLETYSYIEGLNTRYADLVGSSVYSRFAAVADAVYYGML